MSAYIVGRFESLEVSHVPFRVKGRTSASSVGLIYFNAEQANHVCADKGEEQGAEWMCCTW